MKMSTMPMMGKMYAYSDAAEKVAREWGGEVEPMDLQGAFVPTDKSAGNLMKAQHSIHQRFGLDERGMSDSMGMNEGGEK